MAPKEIKDCPVRRNLVTLKVKCRRWDVLMDGKYQKRSRDWQSVADGTRLDPEYAAFLKEIGGLQCDKHQKPTNIFRYQRRDFSETIQTEAE